MSAIEDKATSVLERLEERRQAALLAQLAHNLTVSARETYSVHAEASDQLPRYNEILHLVTAHVCACLKQDQSRFPSRVLFEAIAEKAGKDATGVRLRKRLEWAFGLALTQERLR